MSDSLLLNWAAMAVSLFNAILLLWLGLTVLLNSDRRAWGIWLAAAALLMGGMFFVSHSAILSLSPVTLSLGMVFWWTVGLVPAILMPYGWYVVTLWYSGFWQEKVSLFQRRHGFWFVLTTLIMQMGLIAIALGIFLLAQQVRTPVNFFDQLRFYIRWSFFGIPMLSLAYSGYVVLCIALSWDALRHPGPSHRAMGSLARQRAQPWFAAASLILLVVSLMVAGVVQWLVQQSRFTTLVRIYFDHREAIAWWDLLIASLIAGAILLLGQAIVAYEVFTGKTLPRRGLQRHWRRAVFLAAGYGFVIGGSLAFSLRPLYSLLLTAMLMTLFYALFSWRSYAERETFIGSLRPFITGQPLYPQLLTEATTEVLEMDMRTPFRALCRDLLDAEVAYLVSVGPLAPLVGPPLAYPQETSPALPTLAELTAQFRAPQSTWLSVEPEKFAGATWAIPLWSERGLVGVLLLGEKMSGGLYTQEEMEVARTSGERLIDMKASAEMAHRLMGLQRQRLAESQVVDRRTRRVLHDEVLPQLHTALLSLSRVPPGEAVQEASEMLAAAHRQIANLLREMPTGAAPEVARLGFIKALQRVVEQEFSTAFDQVNWEVTAETENAFRQLSPLSAEVCFYAAREAIRNAARHARPNENGQPLTLTIAAAPNPALHLTIEDDGVGLNAAASPNGGSGQGLALHSTMMAVIGGSLSLESVPQSYTRVVLSLPNA